MGKAGLFPLFPESQEKIVLYMKISIIKKKSPLSFDKVDDVVYENNHINIINILYE